MNLRTQERNGDSEGRFISYNKGENNSYLSSIGDDHRRS